MKILGINYLSESSISYMVDGRLKFSISEERINRIKNWYGAPIESINKFLDKNKIKISEIDCIATHGLATKKRIINFKLYSKKIDLIKKSLLKNSEKKYLIRQINLRKKKEIIALKRASKIIQDLKFIYKKKIFIFDHHECHAASAAYFSGWNESLVMTADGWGDGYSSKLFSFKHGKLHLLRSSSLLDSLGYLYGSITKLLGFIPHRHEGKILGLAAYGNPFAAYKEISDMMSFDPKKKNFISHPENGLYLPLFENKNLKILLKKYKKEDIAAAVQNKLESLVMDYISSVKQRKFKLALAGGIFSNVKLNQKICRLETVKKIFIFPNMGDGGLSVGAAALCHSKFKKLQSKKMVNAYLGFQYSNNEIREKLNKSKLKYIEEKNLEKLVAEELSKGKIIGIFQGRSEFGPRALGNRSILACAKKISINNLLNKKLGRTEFMPFAPITLDDYAKKMYNNFTKVKDAVSFMTTTLECSTKMKLISPGAVHIDGTARPQFVSKKTNEKIYKILKIYNKITGVPSLINTSFNMHEEPIVENPKDAIKTFLRSKIDFLYIGNFLVKK